MNLSGGAVVADTRVGAAKASYSAMKSRIYAAIAAGHDMILAPRRLRFKGGRMSITRPMSGRGRVSRASPVHTAMRNCM